MSKVSIIMPVYNGMEYLESAVNSVLASTHQDLELIMVDDGSSDGSLDLCYKLARRDCRIRVVSQKNQGVAAARNTGIDHASGDWIAFCDQDDYIRPEMYQVMLERAVHDHSDLVICGTGKKVQEHLETVEQFHDEIIAKNDIRERLLYAIMFCGYRMSQTCDVEYVNLSATIWKCLISKKMIDQANIRFRQFIHYEDDRTFLMELLVNAQQVSLVGQCLYYWRINLNSETYRRKFIHNMPKKMKAYSAYEKQLFVKAGISSKIMALYFSIEACNNYVQLVDNECGMMNGRNFSEKIAFLKEEIYQQDFEKNIFKRKLLKTNAVKKKMVLFFLNLHMVRVAYIVNRCYGDLKRKALKYNFWTKVEERAGAKAK